MNLEGTGVSEVFEYIRTGGTLGLLIIGAKFYVDRRRLQIDAKTAEDNANEEERRFDLEVEKQRNNLTLSLLETARAELAALREQLERLRPVGEHLRHFETALEHIETLLHAESKSEREGAERSARAFLNRMRRLAEAKGTLVNEVQRIDSSVTLAERGIKDDEESKK